MGYLVTYDLDRPGQNYQQLWEALRNMGATRLLASVWYLTSNSSAVQLRDYFWRFMDSNDRLLVVRFDEWASYSLMDNIS